MYISDKDFIENSKLYARILFFSEKKEEAFLIWKDLYESDSLDISSKKLMTRELLETKETEMAVKVVKSALADLPDDPIQLMLLAKCEIQKGNDEKGLSMMKMPELLYSQQIEIPIELAKLYQKFCFSNDSQKIIRRDSPILEESHPLRETLKNLIAE